MWTYLSKILRNEQETRKEIVQYQECNGVEAVCKAVCRKLSQREKPQSLVKPPLENAAASPSPWSCASMY